MGIDEEVNEQRRRRDQDPDDPAAQARYDEMLRRVDRGRLYFPEAFKQWMGADFPYPIPEGVEPMEMSKEGERNYEKLIGSELAREVPIKMPTDLMGLAERDDHGYFMAGFWGYGVNSYAFYLHHVTEHLRVFFRLPYGGVYMDEERSRQQVIHFLDGFAALALAHIPASIMHLTGTENMGMGHYQIEYADGQKRDHPESLFYQGEFSDLLSREYQPRSELG